MRAGGGCVVADALAERHRALTGRGCSKPGRRIGLIGLGRRPCSRAAGARRITRSRRSRRRHHDSRLRLGVRVRDRLRWAEAIGYPRALRTRPVTTGPILDAPSFRASALARQATFVDRTPLMRFRFPFSTCQLRCAVRGFVAPMLSERLWPASGRSRFGVSTPPTRALLRDRSASLHPCGFSLFGGAKRCRSKVPDVSEWFTLSRITRRVAAAADSCGARPASVVFDPLVQVSPGEPVSRSRAIRAIERHRFNSPPESGHAPSRSFGAVFRYLRIRALAAWPGDWSFPLFARRRSWGSLPFAVFLRSG